MGATRATKPKRRSRALADEPHLLDTVERLKAMADPIRIRFLLELGRGPRTVKEVAEALEVPPTRLYYHLRILEQNGLVEVANRRMVSGIEERSYRGATENVNISPTLAASALYETGALRALFDVVRAEIEVALQGSPDLPVDDPRSPLKAMAITEFPLSAQDLPKVMRDFEKFLSKYAEPGKDLSGRERFHFFYALYPVPAPPETEDGE
jgi:DNA-binding transcriptional ArsR family regulator